MQPPVFVLDSREQWFPVGVEESLEATLGGQPDWPNTKRLDFPANMRQPADLKPVGYHRTQKGANLVWNQYWLWWLYNPWSILGIGEHEGDWEFIQYGCIPGSDIPILATYSQHHGGGKREAWAVELTGDCRRVAYVALGSHAHYFNSGLLGGGIDQCDGKGRVLDEIEWRPFGSWASWPGRWGSSDGEGKSPQSPGRQGHRWSAPHLFHSAAK